MIIFDLDGTLANCDHRRHFVDPIKAGYAANIIRSFDMENEGTFEDGISTAEILLRVTEDISKNHSKIMNDWCRAYMSQKYKETGIVPKPGDFILNQQSYSMRYGISGFRYWFSEKEF